MNTVNIEPYLPQLQSAFEQHDVSLAYLFGSQAKGNVRPDSDLDIAVLFNNPWEGNSLWEGNPFPDRWEGNPFPDTPT
jgi:predicted nucleotidyltransferase